MRQRQRIMLPGALTAILAVLLLGCDPDAAPSPTLDQELDLVVTGARIVDGTGNPWFRGDVGIRDGRIVAVGDLAGREARQQIHAADRVVAPGFIDMMGQSTTVLLTDPPSAESKLRQGITTYLSGEGGSAAPRDPDAPPVIVDGDSLRWTTYAEYFQLLEERGIPLNVAHNVGLTSVRRQVLGDEDVAPTPDDLEAMKSLVRREMSHGAMGVSTSLIYPPAVYADTDELVELTRAAAEFGGVYFSHIRNESFALLEALQEALTIGEEAGVPVHIYHLKAAGQENWPLMERAIALMDSVRAEGMDVTADIYPYVRNGIGLGSFVHPRHYREGTAALRTRLEDPDFRAELRREIEDTADWENWYRWSASDWDNVLIVRAPEAVAGQVVGRSLAEAARGLGQGPWDLFFELVQGGGVSVTPLSMDEGQKHQALARPWTMIDTDASPVNPERVDATHPRAFGAFPRVIAKYVREDGVLELEDAIRRMTSLAANRLGLHDRGRIAPGMWADVVIFDPEGIRDLATFADPLQYAEGVDYLLVNGEMVIREGEVTGALPGRALRRGGGSP